MNIVVALVAGVLVYLLVKTLVGLVKQISRFAEASGIVAGALTALTLLGII